MKIGTDALGTAENESGSAKHENGTDALNMKMVPVALETVEDESGAQNMKKGHHALVTVENMSGSAKHENKIVLPQYRRK
jgi:hypothetical protein